ncbi:MAG: TonB-dependent receptor [Dysgonamonadaceae bacterium]|jgi:outer membrane cobalamin receptor|nr:TonB-dependent receptor [Dysgonamonadaceae bacterium]
MFKKIYFYFLLGLTTEGIFFPALSAQEIQDTIPIHRLNEVEINASPLPSPFKASAPLQILKSSDWSKFNTMQISDAIQFLSGAQVKDYGGIGGLKTISIRNLGANYTNVAYDGIAITDYQTGQIDLGRFFLDHVETITFHIGESDQILQTAQMQSLAGTLNIITPSFLPGDKKKRQLKASLKAGSFGLINPSVSFGKTLNHTFTMHVSADYLKTDGNYPFKQAIGYANDSIAKRKRNNSDVESLKLEANLLGKFENHGKLRFKTYYYRSERGLPSAVIYYNDYMSERLNDRIFFTQASYTQLLNEKIDFQSNAKFNFSFTNYTNNMYSNRYLENLYYQREYYLNATFRYKFSKQWSFSWANDGIYGNFNSNLPNNVFPSRVTWLSAFSGKYETETYNLTAKLLYTSVNDYVRIVKTPVDYHRFSPYIGFSICPIRNIPFRLRGFYKNTFRMPTFGDIYYSIVTNVNLKPENARQYNIGFTGSTGWGDRIPYFSFAVDLYHNRIENKIVAVPVSSIYIWSTQNYDKVNIQGIDMNFKMHISTSSSFLWKINGTYTHQQVLDKTPESPMYNQQIPYTPRHTASGWMELETPWVNFNYTVLYSGKRYYERINRPEYCLPAFSEHGITLSRWFKWKDVSFSVKAGCQNLFNRQYEVIRSYPMQGRTFRIELKIDN